MFALIDMTTAAGSGAQLRARLPRASLDLDAAQSAVAPVMEDVRKRGEKGIRQAAQRFDGVCPRSLRVDAGQSRAALEGLQPAVRHALERSIKHNRAGHTAQMPRRVTTQVVPGGEVTQRWIPVQRVGLYVPGGLAVYPSSVVMNVVAAQVAGVPHIAVASPPQRAFDGGVHPTILAACALLGVDEVYAVGGAQAIAMFAYGAPATDEGGRGWLCPPVDVITGPGNVYVAAAKRLASATVGIDAVAGTTEIAVIADDSATPAYVAADLLSQAEHDPAAASVLITPSRDLIASVQRELERQVAATPHCERARTALSGPQSGAILVRDLDQAVEVANEYAAEHLEIQTEHAADVAERIVNAGAIFVGPYSPVPLGDYMAGSNHVLPTGGTAHHAAGLSVMSFLKPVQQVCYSRAAMSAQAQDLTALAQAEDLPAHAQALAARTNYPPSRE